MNIVLDPLECPQCDKLGEFYRDSLISLAQEFGVTVPTDFWWSTSPGGPLALLANSTQLFDQSTGDKRPDLAVCPHLYRRSNVTVPSSISIIYALTYFWLEDHDFWKTKKQASTKFCPNNNENAALIESINGILTSNIEVSRFFSCFILCFIILPTPFPTMKFRNYLTLTAALLGSAAAFVPSFPRSKIRPSQATLFLTGYSPSSEEKADADERVKRYIQQLEEEKEQYPISHTFPGLEDYFESQGASKEDVEEYVHTIRP